MRHVAGAHARSRPALPRHRPLLQAARRGPAHPLGLRLLPDAARDQLSVLQDRQRPLGRRRSQAEQLRRHRHHRRRRARRQLPRRVERRAGADAAPHRLFRRAGGQAAGAAHAREAGRHHRAVAGAATAGALLRPHQPLGRRPQLRHVDRVRRRALSPGQLHGHGRAAAPLRRGPRRQRALPPAAARGSACRPCGARGAAHRASARRRAPPACDVYTASYGGRVALLIRSAAGASVNYTVLQVEEGSSSRRPTPSSRRTRPTARRLPASPRPSPRSCAPSSFAPDRPERRSDPSCQRSTTCQAAQRPRASDPVARRCA